MSLRRARTPVAAPRRRGGHRHLAVFAMLVMLVPAVVPTASAERGPPFVPDVPGPAGTATNATYDNVTNTFFRIAGTTPTLFHEGFEGARSLADRGWTEEVLSRDGASMWTVAEENDTLRAQGERTAIVPAGDRTATVYGAYEPNRESRLITPPIDLRYVVGASATTDPVAGQPTLTGLIDAAQDLAHARLATSAARDGNAAVDSFDKSLAKREAVSGREGVGLVNLTFFHLWDLAVGDKAWLDIRTLENGTWSAWSHLDGDLVFETEVDYATMFQASPYCDVSRDAKTQTGRTTAQSTVPQQQNPYKFCGNARLSRGAALSDPFGFSTIVEDDGRVGPNAFTFGSTPARLPASLSGVLETVLEGGSYPPAYYNGHSKDEEGRTYRHFNGTSRDYLDGSLIVRKAHFTLNRFIGKEVQVAFHVKSGPAAAGQYGWFVDEVEVSASVPDRDPSITALTSPQPGDVLADGTRVRPVVKVTNNGRFEVRDLNVTFLLTDVDGRTTLLKETLPVPRLDGVTSKLVAPNALSEPLQGGKGYRLQVSVAASPSPRANATAAASPVQVDANPSNNNMSLTFAVRTVRDVRVFVDVPSDAVMTDVDAPKDGIRVRVENRGNVNTTGVLNVTVHRYDEANRTLGPVLDVVLSETLPASELPFGKDLNVQGSSANVATRAFSWTGPDAGIYVVNAVFRDATGAVVEALPQSVFVRRTPLSNLGPLDIAPAAPWQDLHIGAVDQICLDAALKNCFRSWGYAGQTLNENKASPCGVPGDQDQPPPLCPLPDTIANLGTAGGDYVWVASHDDGFAKVQAFHDTNILDEGILEAKIPNFGPGLLGAGDRFYVTFRHVGSFNWSEIDDNFANPNGFRGQFRVLEDAAAIAPAVGDADTTDGPQRVEQAPDNPAVRQERLLYSVNFTRDALWDRVVIDLTPVLAKMKKGESKPVQLQWVTQTTPPSLVPDWRNSNTARDRTDPDGQVGQGSSECASLGGAGACTLFDPLPRWGIDNILVFRGPPSPVPYPVAKADGKLDAFFEDGAESTASHAKFTDCKNSLDANGHQRPDTSQSAGAALETATRKCRQWQREWHFRVPTMWHLDATKGKGPPTFDGADDTWWLRWGNPLGLIDDDSESHQSGRVGISKGFYTILQTPRFELDGAQRPQLSFDQWHAFQVEQKPFKLNDPGTSLSRIYPTEGGNVWISGYDEDGVRVVHDILFAAATSPSVYDSEVPWHNVGSTYPIFRGVEPEWSSNYTKMKGVKSAFTGASGSGSGSSATWERVAFDLSPYATEERADLTYALEFHAFQYAASASTKSAGWRLDNIEVREKDVANDVAIADVLSPASLVGPGVEQPVVVRVTNAGYFAQRGVQLNYTIYDAGGDAVFGPVVAKLPYGGPGDELPGRLDADKPDKNATFPFPESWTPTEPGVYRLVARTELSASLDRVADENTVNDVFTKVIEVREHHDVFVHDSTRIPDDVTVSPFLGPVGEARSFSFVVENNGTVPERFLGPSENLFRIEVDIFGEDGKSVLGSPLRQNLREIVPGQKVAINFPDAWVPTTSGVFRVAAKLVYPPSDDGTSKDELVDNVRTVKVLVFDVILPASGENLTTEFTPDDVMLWSHNATRYAGADGWSFPAEFEYPASTETSLVLDRVLNLHSVRSSFLRINQSFDFEEGYDGGRVEVSLDGGRTWRPVEPIQKGGWQQMSTASPFVTDPDTPAYAWTGRGEGTWDVNLGAIDGLHTTATLLEDDFEGRGLEQLRADLTLDGQRDPVPTPTGLVARFAPATTTDAHEIALSVTAAYVSGKEAGKAASVAEVWFKPTGDEQGRWYKMYRDAGTDRFWAKVPHTVSEVGPAYRDARSLNSVNVNILVAPLGSAFVFRAFATGEAVPSESGAFESTAAGLVALPSPRELAFRSAPGQPVLWSDKFAILCKTVSVPPTTRESCRGYEPHTGTSAHRGEVRRYVVPGPVSTSKYLETTLDLRAITDLQGSLRIDVRDTAFLPPVIHDGGQGSRPLVPQTVRVSVTTIPATAEEPEVGFFRDPILQNPTDPDRYWNWTDRAIVFQGAEWAKLAGKRVVVRLEHIVASDASGDVIDRPPLTDMSLGNSDEYGPHYGWGLAKVAIRVTTSRGSQALTALDAATLVWDGKTVTLPAGWTQGAVTTLKPATSTQEIVTSYRGIGDVFAVTSEPFAKDLWRQATTYEYMRPQPGFTVKGPGILNRYWEANASRMPNEVAGGAARLVMPLDLKPAVGTTTLTLNTQYNFRTTSAGMTTGGASGGRVEVSVDDGETWVPIMPIDAKRAPVEPTPHPGQVTAKGDKLVPRSALYGRMFHDARLGGVANHFSDDAFVSVGRPSEFGAATEGAFAFTGQTGQAGLAERVTPTSGTIRVRDWHPAAFDLTEFAGRDILVAFHATFSGTSVASEDPGSSGSYLEKRDFWRIDDMKVVGEVFQGSDVRIRLRASSDATVSGSGWDIRDLQVLSQKHLLNVGARVVSPTAADDLHVGANPFAVEVSNKGLRDVEDVEVTISVEATGAGAPAARAWSGKLNAFSGCEGDAVPSDNVLRSEQAVRLCGTVADGTLTFSASPGVEYAFKVFAVHKEFADELLVGDNIDTERISGSRVIARDYVKAERVTLLPSILDRAEQRPVTATATLALVGFDRADVVSATLDLLGDPEVPFQADLGDASSFDPRFTEPGETRSLTWTIPRETLDALRDGVYSVRVTVMTAGNPTPSVVDAPLYKGASIRPTPGFLFEEPVDMANVPFFQVGPALTGEFDTSSGNTAPRTLFCQDDPTRMPHRWCTYHTPANETWKDPAPSVMQNEGGGGNENPWRIGPVAPVPPGTEEEDIAPSVIEHGRVFNLPAFKNVCSVQTDSNGVSGPCVDHFRAVSLETPPIDVRGMGGTLDRKIGVQFSERHDFGEDGVFAKVYVAPWMLGEPPQRNGYSYLYQQDPEGTKDKGWIDIGTITGRSSGNSDLAFVTFAADAGAAIAANWSEAVATRPNFPETYDFIKVRIVVYMPPETTVRTFQVDDLIVSPFVTTIGPKQSIPLNDDTDKTYTYFLKNAGGFSDVVNVTLRKSDGGRTDLPSGWNVTLIDADGAILDQLGPAPASTDRCAPVTGAPRSVVEMAAGEVRRVYAKVCIPVTSGQPGRTGYAPIDITAFSQKLPGLLASTSLELDYSYLNRPNLKVVGLRTNGDVPVDQPRQVSVEVHNTGTLAACAASIGLVDRRAGEPDVEVYGASGLRPDVGACRKRADGVLDGGIAPGEGRQFRFVWTPHGVGAHELVAVADPDNVISELSEADNALNQTLDIRLPSFPDVVARVTVSDDEPNIGDAVRVSLALTNTGGAAAQSVNVTMKVGVTDLLGGFNEGLVPRIGPGETVWLNKTWRAVFPGKVLLYVNALPRDGVLERVETQGNNLVVQPLFVRSQGLDVTAKVVGVDAAPGEARAIGFIISNNGDTPDAYDLVLDAPRGVRGSIFLDGAKVESISLANRTSRNLTVILDLPAEFPAGDHTLGLRAVSQNTTQTRVAQFTLAVKALYGFFLEAAQAEAKPGRVEVPLSLTNLGNANDPYEIDVVNAPPGWKGVPTPGVVAPYAEVTAKLVLDVPTTTPRGIYEVLARVRDNAGTEATAVVGVTLLDYQAAVPSFEAESVVVRPSSLVPTTVTLVNEGNVRAETAVRVLAPEGWRVELDRPTLVLDAGESAEVRLDVVVPPTARFGSVGEVKLVTTSGGVERVAVLDVEVGESDLHVLELDYAPRVGLQPGSAVDFTAIVRNDGGLDAHDVGVAFYVDDLLAGYETVGDLAAGGERTVSFRWSADAGEHVVLAILDPGNTVRETDEANNARLEVVRVARAVGILSAAREDVPGLGALATVGVLGALAVAIARKRTR